MAKVEEAAAFVQRLQDAVDNRDLDALVGCFEPDYRNETPAHPARAFVGRDQVRANWELIFDGVPDISAEVLRTAVEGDVVWSEWQMRGTRPDGLPHLMRGVIIFGTRNDRAAWARFYLEPVDPAEVGADAAISQILGTETPR